MVEQLGQPYYSYVPEASPHLNWDTIWSHRLTSFHPFQRLSDLKFLDSPHKAPIDVIKRVIQLKGCVHILTIEQSPLKWLSFYIGSPRLTQPSLPGLGTCYAGTPKAPIHPSTFLLITLDTDRSPINKILTINCSKHLVVAKHMANKNIDTISLRNHVISF